MNIGASIEKSMMKGMAKKPFPVVNGHVNFPVIDGHVIKPGSYSRAAVLYQTDLRGANLSNSIFDEAQLIQTKLNKADISNASLKESILVGADLSGADLTNTRARSANFSGADRRLDRIVETSCGSVPC